VRLTLTASQRLNIGENGDSLATTVRLYLLKDSASLVEASLDQLIDGDRTLIGEDLVSVQEITLYPGEKAEPILARREGANLVAVVALFRRPSGPAWRAIRKLETPNPYHCHVSNPVPTVTSPVLRFHLEESRIEMQ
jgi:type VI secretion system protein VasD